MARPATGEIIEYRTKAGEITRTLRFQVNGEAHRKPLGVVSREDAERELSYVLADVARGTYEPAQPTPPSPNADGVPGFHDFADEWFAVKRLEIGEGTQGDYQQRLEVHLIPFFAETPLDQIDVNSIDRYKAEKLGKGLSPRTVNMQLVILSAILESAVERGLIAVNPSNGKRRRVKERKAQRTYLDTAAHLRALLDAAGELDRKAPPKRKHVHRRAMLATLIFAGVRIGELLELRWRDVDLATGRLTVRGTKTDQAVRKVRIRGGLRDELTVVRASRDVSLDPNAYVFPTTSGKQFGIENFRNRVLAGSVRDANEALTRAGEAPLPEGITPHSLRRTFASLLYALGEAPPVVMAEMGHADPELALRIYAQAMGRDDAERSKLRALVEGMGFTPINADERESAQTEDPATT